jgi:hypothetical protein
MRRVRRPGAGNRASTAPSRRISALVIVTAASGTLALAGCGSSANGADLARQACVHVERSVGDYVKSNRPGTPPGDASQLQKKADRELRDALPLAAAANSDDGSWNSLMTTISESATIDEGHLVPALSATCRAVDAPQNVNPQAPSSTAPRNVNPVPAAS